ncbi:MAG: pantetheine-phosphate adenylyltransferase [Verrucomicrobiota bacterium]
MRKAIYPGSFDPVTRGHLDVIQRAAKLFDEVVVAVARNDQKQPLFTTEERVSLLEASIDGAANIQVIGFESLLIDLAREQGAIALVRGMRAVSDFEFEFQMALMNRHLAQEIETIFLMPHQECIYISSRIVKEVAQLGGDVSGFVTEPVRQALLEKFHPQTS